MRAEFDSLRYIVVEAAIDQPIFRYE
jgi:hypothetical protein